MQIPKRKSKRKPIVTILVLLLGFIGGLGYVGWNEFQRINAANKVGEVVVKETTAGQFEQVDPLCAQGEDDKATSGTFCSEEMGIKFAVPKLFVGNIAKAANYPVYQSQLNPSTKTRAGSSLAVYSATASSAGAYTFTIAQEPLRTGYVDVHHALQDSYFDATTKELFRVTTPTAQYNYTTNSTTTSGVYAKGEAVPSFTTSSTRFYEGTNGDAGTMENIYFTVINDKIVKISLKYVGNPAGGTTAPTKVYDELTKSLKALRVL